jgi:conjugative transposon TraN protein
MKKKSMVMIAGVFLVLTSIKGFSQSLTATEAMVIKPYPLTITFYKTTNVIFPFAIKSVDRGSADILAQKAKGVENILELKAAKENFKETNLTVITADGKFYSYVVNYSDSPSVLNIQFSKDGSKDEANSFFSSGMNEANIQTNAEKIAGEKRTIHKVKDKKYGMKLQLQGLYIKEDVIYYQMKLQNRSNISYDIDQFRFFIRDEKKLKRTASQELEMKPLYVYGDTASVGGQSERVFLFALPKFTIPDNKFLDVQLFEKNGGRNLELKIHNKTIIKANSINP